MRHCQILLAAIMCLNLNVSASANASEIVAKSIFSEIDGEWKMNIQSKVMYVDNVATLKDIDCNITSGIIDIVIKKYGNSSVSISKDLEEKFNIREDDLTSIYIDKKKISARGILIKAGGDKFSDIKYYNVDEISFDEIQARFSDDQHVWLPLDSFLSLIIHAKSIFIDYKNQDRLKRLKIDAAKMSKMVDLCALKIQSKEIYNFPK